MKNESTLVFCPRCGAATKPDVCENCGYVFEEEVNEYADIEQDTYELKEDKIKKKNYGPLIGIIIVVVVVVLLVGILLICGGGAAAAFLYQANVNSISANNVGIAIEDIEDQIQIEIENDIEDDIIDDTDDPIDDPIDEIDPDKDKKEDDDIVTPNEDDQYHDNVSGYKNLVENYDIDDLNQYLDNANELYDNEADSDTDVFLNGYYNNANVDHNQIDRDKYPIPYFDPIRESYVKYGEYDVERYHMTYEGEVNGVLVNGYFSYYQIVSDKLDYTKVNEELKKQALASFYAFATNKSKDSELYNYKFYVDSVITYNDDKILSVVYDVATFNAQNYRQDILLRSVNVDIPNAQVMDNSKILKIDEDLAALFKERCYNQMGPHDYVDDLTTKEIVKILNNPQSLIVFFSPCGLEFGYQYLYKNGSGWITCTVNDFSKYLSGDYDINTNYSLQYDVYAYERKYGNYSQQNGSGDPLDGYYDDSNDSDM